MTGRPNIVMIVADDHATRAISAYGSEINATPNIDRIAQEGARFDNCFCTNSLCTPSRAAILTGTYNHINGVTTLDTPMDNGLPTFPKLLRSAGYQTALFGKWHLGHGPKHDPTGFDDWEVLRNQGTYFDPEFLSPHGSRIRDGYVTETITDLCLEWIDNRDAHRPFMLICHHKAPHDPWIPSPAYETLYEDTEIPEPHTFWDDYSTRAQAAELARCRMMDLTEIELKGPVPSGLSELEEVSWRYQRFIKDYLRVVAAMDDQIGRLLDHLDDAGLSDDTIVVYTSDQGYFLGEHGWFDKRFIYEESIGMPFVLRYPQQVQPGTIVSDMVLNIDFAPYLLDAVGVDIPDWIQGESFRPLLERNRPEDWRTSMYYRYWMHRDAAHEIWAHYGVRTMNHKLVYFYADPLGQAGAHGPSDPPEWELYDLNSDPFEVTNVYGHPENEALIGDLKAELGRLQDLYGDDPA